MDDDKKPNQSTGDAQPQVATAPPVKDNNEQNTQVQSSNETQSAATPIENVPQPISGGPISETTADSAEGTEVAQNEPVQDATTEPATPKKSKKILLIVVILVSAGLLIAGVVYFYASGDKTETADNSQNTAETQQQAQVAPATTSDIDDTTKEIDETLESMDSLADVASSDLSDDSLGL